MLRATLIAALLPLASLAAAQTAGPLVEAREPRAERGDGGSLRVFAILENRGEAPAELVELRSDAAEMATLVAAPAATPGAVPETLDGLILPPGVETALEPQGIHVLLSGVPETLAEGDEVAVTLVFEPAAEVELRAAVQAPTAE
jgi:copper(I)-binding protein